MTIKFKLIFKCFNITFNCRGIRKIRKNQQRSERQFLGKLVFHELNPFRFRKQNLENFKCLQLY